ncbi:multifunctional tRNA nucleotidyl transferase/2'3'-cyclic phosphodiesterase/2'nucleotidase/phosphatase [Oryzomicrobium terrae]|uniref:Multifunctional CCA protein n=2 Tax=Oryzomicrobium terrae TaxID=1735038 RepID=A0A5C1EE82_9RHOO|nr:multifunctional tRNA nucleotidyl transferase/2'3'-cyclic phosphodiesterase/2'nucleotidase/phosphatase [Oryzomicrobium terrae]
MEMKTYIVGGAVRDRLLGRPVNDRDYVVVGASPEAMVARGFLPVGRDFPVFLHPKSKEEYALARTERKTGRGYHGFAFYAAEDVTLEEDLARRDLTINAMAEEVGGDGTVVDPYGGQADLAAKVLRHVGPAFAEDPVRILRLARFAARFADFTVAPETLALMRAMVDDGEADHLVPERVWQEISRGLMEPAPSRMLQVLRECGALARLAPEIDALFGVPQRHEFHPEGDVAAHLLLVIDRAAARGEPLPVRFAALCHDLGKGTTPAEYLPRHHGHEERGVPLVEALCARWKVPTDCRDLARLCTRYHGTIHRAAGRDEHLTPSTFVKVLEHCDAFRRPERFVLLLAACACDAQGRLGHGNDPYPATALWQRALAAAAAVDGGAIARLCQQAGKPATIPARLHEARVAAVAQALAAAG